MRGTVDLALVPAFVEVVRQGSFTAAAKVLGLPKSTVSRRVARLEADLAAPLLVRTTRQLRLTEAGEAFYARAACALEGFEAAARVVAEQREEPHGHLRISVPPDYTHLPGVVAAFVERYPDVHVEVEPTGRTVDLVGEGYDLAIRAGRLRDSSLIASKLASVSFHLFASERYLARRGVPERVADLGDHDCVLFGARRGVARWTLHGPEGIEDVDVRGPISADDLLFLRGAVVAGAGIGLLPQHVFATEDGVRRVLPEYEVPGGAIHVVYPGARHVPAKVRAFRGHLLEHRWFG